MNKNLVIKISICAVLLIILIVAAIATYTYLENKRIDAEAITLKKDLSIVFGEEAKVSDFLENLNGTLVKDNEINTEKVGKVKVSFEYINIKNKKRTGTYEIEVKDITEPRIFGGTSYTVTVGNEKDLTQIFLSGDDIDDNPTREIIGEYDFNEVGDYDLKYVITDASGNQTSKDFVLHVKEKSNGSGDTTQPPKKEYTKIEDVIDKYKTDDTKIGIDVSKWQDKIDWAKVKEAGVEFAMIRMGYQKGYDEEYVLDPFFEENIKGAKAENIPVGVYFYSYAKTPKESKEQAEWVVKNISKYDIDLPVAFDWESWNSFNTTKMSFYKLNKSANVFMETVEKAGYEGMLYSSKTYLEDIWYPTEYQTWLAHYTKKGTNYTGDYSMWQLCQNGKVDGINNDVDIDVMY